MQNADKYFKMYDLPIEEIIDKAYRITKRYFRLGAEFCSIISTKTGGCSENCKYCVQSAHNEAQVEATPMMTPEEVENAVQDANRHGVTRFGIVISGRKPSGEDFNKLLEIIKKFRALRV